MIKGMTGFGSVEISSKDAKILVEIKSLNHRYLDLNFYLPPGFTVLESKVRALLQRKFKRGRVSLSIKILQKPGQVISFNKDVIKKYLSFARGVKRTHKLKGELTISDLVQLPGVVEAKETVIRPEKLWPQLKKGINKAANDLLAMRTQEGKSLHKDIADKIKRMGVRLNTIEKRAATILKSKKRSFTEEELVSYQRTSDINEEVARMKHYLVEVKKLIKSSASVGKKVDFIAQEMQRETNTIGAKLQDRIVSNAVIALKSKIEKIREQAQNIE